MSADAFSLQQLLFYLDNAAVQSQTGIEGVVSSTAKVQLAQAFLNIYVAKAKDDGLPVAGVTAVADTKVDKSPLHLTNFNRQVTLFKDSNGAAVRDPTLEQKKLTTLDYVCVTNDHFLPALSDFEWNWVREGELAQKSGIIAINRDTFGAYLKDQVLPLAWKYCIKVNPSVEAHWTGEVDFYWDIQDNQDPDTYVSPDDETTDKQKRRKARRDAGLDPDITDSGETVVAIDYMYDQKGQDWAGLDDIWYGGLRTTPIYTCDISFKGQTVTVVQRSAISIWAGIDATGLPCRPVDTTITDTYTISVDEEGNLGMTKDGESIYVYNPDLSHRSGIVNFFTGINDLCDEVAESLNEEVPTDLLPMQFNDLQRFVFPGASVFTYKATTFSGYQDLLCDITYLSPTAALEDGWTRPRRARKARKALPMLAQDPASTKSLTYFTALMQNYIRGQLIAHQGKFEAIQTTDGHTLLFALDTLGALLMFEEQSGQTSTGWLVHDLSSKIIKKHFPNSKVRTFDVAQSALDGTIGIMMAVRSGDSDHLFMSLLNSPTSISWASNPSWVLVDFDAADDDTQASKNITIRGALFAEISSNNKSEHKQYLVVDIDRRNESANLEHVERYYIDPKARGRFWVKHDVPVDLESDDYQSCIGRPSSSTVDGIYMKGKAAGSSQFLYVPIINPYDPDVAPTPVLFKLPDSKFPSAIATARNMGNPATAEAKNINMDVREPVAAQTKNISTDLYAVAGSSLYRFDADKQRGKTANSSLMVTDDLLSGTNTLLAMICDDVTTLWGKNGSDQVYYLSFLTANSARPELWSAPVPILSDIEHISVYMNVVDGGNTIFAAGGNKLQKLTQDPNSKLWQAQEIRIAPTSTMPPRPATEITSYITTLPVANSVTGLPAQGVPVKITANCRTPVYMNGLYYVLDTAPVTVATDSAGGVAMIEATSDINGTTLNVSVDGNTTSINPMEDVFHKLTTFTEEGLRTATFYKDLKAGGIQGSPKPWPLVASGTDVEKTAEAFATLNTVYLKTKMQKRRLFSENGGIVPATLLYHCPGHFAQIEGVFDDIALAAGDLFRWLKSGVTAVVSLFQDIGSKIWIFVAKIAGKAYHAFLDTIEAIVGAVEWLFNAIETGIQDLIRFAQFLFEWDDIKRTKEVMHNISKLYLQNQIQGISKAKALLDKNIEAVEQTVTKWAKITDWSKLGDLAEKPAADSTSNPTQGQTSGSQLLLNHFQDNASDLTIVGATPTPTEAQGLINIMLDAISKESQVLGTAYNRLKKLANKFSSLTIQEVLKEVVGILVGGILSSVKVVVDAMLDVLQSVLAETIALLDTEICIPIISDILTKLGVPKFSFLDLITWIAAVGYTVVYKIVNNRAPFLENAPSKAMIEAKSWDDMVKLFKPSTEAGAAIDIPDDVKKDVRVSGLGISAFLKGFGSFLVGAEAEAETGENPFSIVTAIVDAVASASAAGTGMLAPLHPIKDLTVTIISDLTDAATVGAAVLFSGPVQKKFAAAGTKFPGMATGDGRATGAIVDTILIIPALFATGWHFYELVLLDASLGRTADILGEVSKLASYVARVSYTLAVNDKDPNSKQIPIAVLIASNVALAGLQTAQGSLISRNQTSTAAALVAPITSEKANDVAREPELTESNSKALSDSKALTDSEKD